VIIGRADPPEIVCAGCRIELMSGKPHRGVRVYPEVYQTTEQGHPVTQEISEPRVIPAKYPPPPPRLVPTQPDQPPPPWRLKTKQEVVEEPYNEEQEWPFEEPEPKARPSSGAGQKRSQLQLFGVPPAKRAMAVVAPSSKPMAPPASNWPGTVHEPVLPTTCEPSSSSSGHKNPYVEDVDEVWQDACTSEIDHSLLGSPDYMESIVKEEDLSD